MRCQKPSILGVLYILSHDFRDDEPPNARLTDGVPTMIPESLGYRHQYVISSSIESEVSHVVQVRTNIGNLRNLVSSFRRTEEPRTKFDSGNLIM
jgi:hypothetical protein